jgi:hypothetical protein
MDKQERVVLTLGTGDGYSMDGVMQQHYTHGVERVTTRRKGLNQEGSNGRIAMVFRQGNKVTYKDDSGSPCLDLKPPDTVQEPKFGAIPGLVEGHIYSRGQLHALGAHRSQHRGVSGNQFQGCDAIILSGKKERGPEETDDLITLTYSAASPQQGSFLCSGVCKKNWKFEYSEPRTTSTSSKPRYQSTVGSEGVLHITGTMDCILCRPPGKHFSI